MRRTRSPRIAGNFVAGSATAEHDHGHPGDAAKVPAPDEDQPLIARIRGRDRDSLGVLFDRWADRVYSVALHLLGDPAEAEDVVEEVFAQVWRDVEDYHPGCGSVGAWIILNARRRALGRLQPRTTESRGNVSPRLAVAPGRAP